MPYIVLSANGQEIHRTDLKKSVIIGRSAECDVAIRDILLSRKHARVEAATGKDKGRWRFVDLESRNGSTVNWKKVRSHTLVDGDLVRIGRTWLTFRSGDYIPPPPEVIKAQAQKKLVRPADPFDALSGTIADFVYSEQSGEDHPAGALPIHDMPPMRAASTSKSAAESRTAVPAGKAIYSPLDDISSSLQTIVATASNTRRRVARPMPKIVVPIRRQVEDTSLQAQAMQVPYLEVVPALKQHKRNWMPAIILTIGISIATALVVISGWVMTHM